MTFSVRTSDPAEIEIEANFQHLFLKNADRAFDWLTGLRAAIASLDFMPRRCPQIRAKAYFGTEVRQLIYRDHRILFAFTEDEEGEAEQVVVLRVLHTAQRPLDEVDEEDD